MRILLALDGSPTSEAATRTLIEQMKPAGSDVRLLHIVEPFPVKLAEAEGSNASPDFDRARLEQRQAAERLLKNAATKLQAAGFNVTWMVQEGDPRMAILDDAEAWSADLIVVGSHGRTGLQRLLMGSVSEAVARHAACSVEIIRPRGPR